MPVENNYTFTNLHQNVSFKVERYYTLLNRDANGDLPGDFLTRWNCGITNIQAALADAIHDNKKVRVIGGGWSLSDVQQTSDYFINPNGLNMIQVGLQTNAVSPGVAPGLYCLAQCGASVMEINEQLRLKKLALPTTGASDGQSIVGAFSTGTHGAAVTFGAMPDFVEALHIIVSDTVHYWVEGDQPVVNDVFIRNYTPGAVRINSDEILNAAVVSFGSFGVIHAALLKVEPLYSLVQHQKYVDWGLVQNHLNWPADVTALGLPNDNLYNFTVLTNPYKLNTMVACVMQKVPFTAAVQPNTDHGFGPSNDVLNLIGAVAGIIPHSIPSIMTAIDGMIKKQYPEIDGQANIPGWIFTGGTTVAKGKALSVELGVDAAHVLDVANIIFDQVNITPFPGVISFRFVKQTKATLGFLKYGPVSCAVEFPGAYSTETQNFYDALYARLDAAGIEYTFHWGQCNNLNSVNVRQKYGDAAVNSWLNARYALLKTPQQQAMFTNPFMTRLGLDAPGPAIATATSPPNT